MILKKPYAFLIKNFKLLHIILFFILAFIIYKTNKIYNFFNDYLNGNYFDFQENFVSSYIDIFIFFALVIVIIFALTLYWLMKFKNKDKRYYLFLFVYYLAIFFICIYYFIYLGILEDESFDKKVLRIVRDSALVILIPQYLFAAFTLFRGLGFDLKKFNFAKDLQELDIKVEDSEEFEVVLSGDGYKIKRTFRKRMREIYYYIIENKVMLLLVAGVIIIVFLAYSFIDTKINTPTYKEGRNFYADGFQFNITNSYLTTLDSNGDVIKDGKKYVVIKFSVINTLESKKAIDLNNIKLSVGGQNIYPVLSKYNSFIDLGIGYKRGTLLETNEGKTYLLAFEMSKNTNVTNPVIKISSAMDASEGDLAASYMNVNLSLEKSLKTTNIDTFHLGDTINFSESEIKNTKLYITSFDIKDEYEVNYKYCTSSNKCFTGIKPVTGSEISKHAKSVIRVSAKLEKDEAIDMFKRITDVTDFLETFAKVEYTIGGKTLTSEITDITPKNTLNSYKYFEVSENILDSSDVKLAIVIRNKKYTVNLK